MNRTEAALLLQDHMQRFAELNYAELLALMGEPQAEAVESKSGAEYQIEVEVFWDAEPNGLLRVLGSIDDGTLRAAFRPICEDFLVGPGGLDTG